jgi:hypothetical protein
LKSQFGNEIINNATDVKIDKTLNGYDNRNLTTYNLTTYNVDIKNLTTMFNKYKLLKKLENDKYSIYQKIEIINDNIVINEINLLNDWEF